MVRAPFQETSVVFRNEGSYWFHETMYKYAPNRNNKH